MCSVRQGTVRIVLVFGGNKPSNAFLVVDDKKNENTFIIKKTKPYCTDLGIVYTWY